MPTIETIRRLTIEGQSRGMDKVVGDLKAASGAQREFAATSEAVATTTETSAKRVLSAANAYEKMQMRIDPVHKELRGLQNDLTALNNYFAQGGIGPEKYARDLERIIQRTSAFREEQARINAPRQMMLDANPQTSHIDAFRQNQAATLAAAAAHKELTKQTNELLQQIDPVGEATKRYNAQLIQNAVLAGHGKISADQLAAANKRAADNLTLVQKGAGVATQGFTNLSYQINDVISGLVMGQSVFTIAAQQGGQIAQALNGPTGIAGGLRAVGARALEMITPVRVLGTALIGAAVEGAFAWNRLVDQQTRVHVALRTTVAYLGQTTQAFQDMAEAAGRRGGLSERQGVNAALSIAQGGRFDPQTISTMTERLKDFAATIGEDSSTAAAKFGQAMGSLNGILDLNNTKIRFLMGSEVSHIRNLFDQGKAAEASAFALDKLVKLLIPAGEVTGKAASAWAIMKNAVDDLDRSLGKYIQTFMRYVSVGANDLAIGASRGGISGQARNPGEAIGEIAGSAASGIRRMIGGRAESGQSGSISPKGPVAVTITGSEQAAADVAMMKYQQTVEKTTQSVEELKAEEEKVAEARMHWTEQLRLQSLEYGVEEERRRKLNATADFIRQMSAKDVEALDREARANGSVRETIDKVITAAESYNDVRGRRISEDDAIIRRAEIEARLAERISTEERLALSTEKARLDQMGVLQSRQAFDINIQKESNELIRERKTGLEDEEHATERLSRQMLKYGDAKEIDTQIEQKRIQYRQQNMPLNEAEEASLRRVYALSVQRNNIGQQLQRLYTESVQPAKDLNNTIEAANILFKAGEINVRQYTNAIEDARIKSAQAQQTFAGGMEAGLRRLGREWNDVSKQAENFVYSTGNNITSTFLDIADGSKTAADGFRDLGRSFLRMASEMIIKVAVLGPMMKSLTGAFTGGGGGLLSFLGGGAGASASGDAVFGTMHRGGVVGRDVTGYRFIHPAYFDDAPRLHAGTLRPDERAAILQTGEVVLSRQDASAARSAGTQSQPQVMHLNVNVEGARGNREIEEMTAQGVARGIAAYDKELTRGGLSKRMSVARSRGQTR